MMCLFVDQTQNMPRSSRERRMGSLVRMLFIRMVSPLWSFSTSGISYMMFSMAATAMQSTTVMVSETKTWSTYHPKTHKFVVPQIIRLQVVQHGIALVVYSNTIRQAPTEPGVQHHGAAEQMSKVPRDDLRPSLHHHIDGSRHFLIGVGGNIPTKSYVEERGTFWTDTEGWRSTPRCSCR